MSLTTACGDDDGMQLDAGFDAGGHEEDDAGPPDAGADEDAGTDAGGLDAGSDAGEPDAGPDAGALDGGPPALLDVSHDRELRAMWLSTVFRLDFPSAAGVGATQARAELTAIADVCRAAGINAIFFQVRPESDALYASTLEPWSRFLTDVQGVGPGWDPLGLLLEIAHERGIEVHAWVNPYRALTSTSVTPAASHVTQRFPDAAITYGGAVVMNPAADAVRAHIVAVVTEIVREYDVDGVVFDDYFYPYPRPGEPPFADSESYQAYVDAGGVLSLGDWRRDNVNRLVAGVSDAIKTEKPWVMWGIAPFGIYRPGMPPGVAGTDAYEVLAADSVRWISEGWVDYLAPQLYWSTVSSQQPFGALVSWWADLAPPGRFVIPSLALHREGAEWNAAEFERQVMLTRAEAPRTAGNTWFRYRMLANDLHGSRAMMARVYSTPARPPAVIETAGDAVEPPVVMRTAGNVTLSHPSPTTIRGYAVYRDVDGSFEIDRWIPAGSPATSLGRGRWAISAIARGGAESQGVEVLVP
ncbi:Putative glycoside hydrolase [Sandaracinus amylolyticus]|uniref:Putative glycoside hydrolase n=1 Tax=Sandaracinus amylolyticus TaxID=927083 RepID=A0A0F6SHD1_9BACT|nr:Putative glycoside hydrolase [Sandaracinus amylolyticus]